MTTARIAFLGQGRMGVPMARRLVAGGHHVSVWNRTARKCAPAAAAGARTAGTPAEAAQDADLVITMVRDATAVAGVLFGVDGAGPAIAPGGVVVELSTVGPDAVADLRRRLRPDIGLVDAPVVGSVAQATAGELQLLVGGTDADVSRCAGVLATLGSVTRFGPLGAGAAAKLVVNAVSITSFAVIGEAFALGDRLGIAADTTLELLGRSALGPFVERIRERIGTGTFPTQFALGLAEKDLALALSTGGCGAIAAAHRHLAAAVRDGLGERDISALIGDVRSRTAGCATDDEEFSGVNTGEGTQDDLLSEVRNAWAEVLGNGSAESVPLDANFLEAGGNSLLLVMLWEQLQPLAARPLKLSELFQHATVRAQAALLVGPPAAAAAVLEAPRQPSLLAHRRAAAG